MQRIKKLINRFGLVGKVSLITIALCTQTYCLPIQIIEQQNMGFGYAFTGANACEVDFSGVLSGDCLGTGLQGIILITGDPNTALSVSVTGMGWVGDLKLTPEILRKFSYVTNSVGELEFNVAGKIQMRSGPAGNFNLQYTITVFYQ